MADKHDAALAMFQTKLDHAANCRTCRDGIPSQDAATWPQPRYGDDLDVLDRTAEVARGTR